MKGALMQTLKGLRAAGAPPLQPRPGGTVMAQYSFSVKTVSRSAGRSATGAAAYRAGERIEDERTGVVHDYSRKGGVVSARLYAPADAPEWAADRAAMWNVAEQKENRKNSTVAREFLAALPHEMTDTQRAALVDDFARELVDRYGFVLDAAIHRPSAGGDQRNHHAHLLATTRDIGPDGFDKKTRSLDSRQSGEVEHLRERWAEVVNRHLERCQIAERVDHRSLADQGIDRPAQIHQGPAATAMERRGIETDRGDHNREAVAWAHAQTALAKVRADLDLERDIEAYDAQQAAAINRDEPSAGYVKAFAQALPEPTRKPAPARPRQNPENGESKVRRTKPGAPGRSKPVREREEKQPTREDRQQAEARRIIDKVAGLDETAAIAFLREEARQFRRRPRPSPPAKPKRADFLSLGAAAAKSVPVAVRRPDGSTIKITAKQAEQSARRLAQQADRAKEAAEALPWWRVIAKPRAEREAERLSHRAWRADLYASKVAVRAADSPAGQEARRKAAEPHYQQAVEQHRRDLGRHEQKVEQWEDRQAVADTLDGVADRAEQVIEERARAGKAAERQRREVTRSLGQAVESAAAREARRAREARQQSPTRRASKDRGMSM